MQQPHCSSPTAQTQGIGGFRPKNNADAVRLRCRGSLPAAGSGRRQRQSRAVKIKTDTLRRTRRPVPGVITFFATLSCLFTRNANGISNAFYDPDCVREDPFWQKYQNLIAEAVTKNEAPDFHVSRYALQIPGCPLGKLVACVGSEDMAVRDCFYHIPVDFYLLMSSRWPVLKLLDMEQQKIWRDGGLEDDNGDDCINAAHPSLDWNQFRGALADGVDEAYDWLLANPSRRGTTAASSAGKASGGGGGGARANLGWAVAHADGIVFKSQSDAVISLEGAGSSGDGSSSPSSSALSVHVGQEVNRCEFGVLSANALRMFAMLLSDGDVYRMLERGFQTIEQIWNRKHQLLYSRWRLFGLVHVLSELKKQKLDLPEQALTEDLDQPPGYMQSKNPWDWAVGDFGLDKDAEDFAAKKAKHIKLIKKPMPMEAVSRADYQNEGTEVAPRDSDVMPIERPLETTGGGSSKAGDPGADASDADEGSSDSDGTSGGQQASGDADEVEFLDEKEQQARGSSSGSYDYEAIDVKHPKHPSNVPEGERDAEDRDLVQRLSALQQKPRTREDNNEIYWRLSKIVRNNRILLTSVDSHSNIWLKNWLRRAKYSMKQGGIGIVLQNTHLDLQCKSVASGQLSKLDHSLEKYMCLPKLSDSSVFLSVLGYMRIGVLAGYDMGYVSISHFWVRNPFPHLWVKDVNVETEFFNQHKTRATELLAVKGSARGLLFLTDLLSLVYFFPFTYLPRALDRLVFGPHITDRVPTVSFAEDNFLHYHLFFVHFYETESKFVSTDGWFGNPQTLFPTSNTRQEVHDGMIFFDIQKLISDHERQRIFDVLYSGTIGPAANHPIRVARTSVSPRRKTWGAYLLPQSATAATTPGSMSTSSSTTAPSSSGSSSPASMAQHEFLLLPGNFTLTLNRLKPPTPNANPLPPEQQTGSWRMYPGFRLAGGVVELQDYTFTGLSHAQNLCLQLGADICGGVTCKVRERGISALPGQEEECFIRDGTPLITSQERDGVEADVEAVKGGSGEGATRVLKRKDFKIEKIANTGGEKGGERGLSGLPGDADGLQDPLNYLLGDKPLWAKYLLRPSDPGEPASTVQADSDPDEEQEVSFIPQGFNLLSNEKILHVNFATDCCYGDAKHSAESAVKKGKVDVSYQLRMEDLSAEFREKNEKLLKYERTAELTHYKTPTGKVGYYVWKPEVILKMLREKMGWGDVLVYTDAGISFLTDVRPLIARYLRGADVAATQTPMMEADFTKRDAFILTNLDYATVAEMSQIASGVILVRKTPLSLLIMEEWLRYAEDERILTEEPNVLGFPNYPAFKNHNDDQSVFSLVFKKYGQVSFPQSTRDAYFLTGRNLAKYMDAATRFARGETATHDSYIAAADGRDDKEILTKRDREFRGTRNM